MARELPSGYATGLATNPVQNLAVLCELHWADQITYLWTGTRDFVYDSNTYLGIGQLGKISKISESSGVQADGIELELVGIPSAMVSTVLSEARQGKSVKIHQVLFDADWANPIVVENVFKGFLDVPIINKSVTEAKITVKAENRLIELQRNRVRRYTDQDQKELFPGNPSLEFVAALQDKDLRWGTTERGDFG